MIVDIPIQTVPELSFCTAEIVDGLPKGTDHNFPSSISIISPCYQYVSCFLPILWGYPHYISPLVLLGSYKVKKSREIRGKSVKILEKSMNIYEKSMKIPQKSVELFHMSCLSSCLLASQTGASGPAIPRGSSPPADHHGKRSDNE